MHMCMPACALQVLIVHMQYFVIITRLNINWPSSIHKFQSSLSTITGVTDVCIAFIPHYVMCS